MSRVCLRATFQKLSVSMVSYIDAAVCVLEATLFAEYRLWCARTGGGRSHGLEGRSALVADQGVQILS